MKELELYIHIPFCVRKCRYCDFLSWAGGPKERERYVQTLIREIRSYDTIAKAYQVPTVFFGGGTPSILEENQMQRIVDALQETFIIEENAEITMEVNPGMIQSSHWNPFVNRISFGLQSTHNGELEILGRIHTYEEFLSSYEQARQAGCRNINIDLISSVPGQSVESWRENLQRIVELKPEHISAYSLIIEEGTPFYELYGENGGKQRENMPKLPTEEEEALMYELTQKVLQEAGYVRYEVSNYARFGYECRHNVGYWKRREYLGLGLGASSLMNHRRFSVTTSVEEYCEYDWDALENLAYLEERLEAAPVNAEAPLTLREEMEEFMFLGLRMTQGVSMREFEDNFQIPMEQVYGQVIEKYRKLKLLEVQGDRLYLNPKGMEVSNQILAEFL